jgi:acyl-[acyl-carrier-protein]-phospholipid O-acyltransferase/long-chain-fatty-acid--[acyl-carrier-protein] ligase
MFCKEGTVGRFLPKIEYVLQPVAGVENGGRLQVKGDNVMLGYMKADKPNVLEKAAEWYDTGDIVEVDADGFIHIQGRAKRFAKIGGEMVSLTAVEQIIDKLYPDAKQGVITVTDEKKGERIVLITSADSASLSELHKYFKKQNVSELWMPKEVVYMKTPPLLGSGKFDYLKAKAMYDEQHQV